MGLRLEFTHTSEEESDAMYVSGDGKNIFRTNKYTFSPVIGAEYLFAKHFSFGGEVGLKYLFINGEQPYSTDSDIDQDLFTTDSGLFLRFYF